MPSDEFEIAADFGIPFTQFIPPRGKKRPIFIHRPEGIMQLANNFIEAGGWFEVEKLPNIGMVALTACWNMPHSDNDVVCEIVKDGPAVPEAVDKLVERAEAWRLLRLERKMPFDDMDFGARYAPIPEPQPPKAPATAADLLWDAMQLLKGHWVQLEMATDDDGHTVPANSPNATCWCSLGALCRVLDLPDYPEGKASRPAVLESAEQLLCNAASQDLRDKGMLVEDYDEDDGESVERYENAFMNSAVCNIPEWNDIGSLQEADVLRVFEMAAMAAEESGV